MEGVIKHRFWICSGVSFLLIVLGWYMGTSSLAKEAQENRDKIEGAENGLPKGDQHPNDNWIAKIKEVNKVQVQHYHKQAEYLWNLQKTRQKWPTDVAPLMAKAEHFGKGSSQKALELFRVSYHDQTIEDLYRIVEPVEGEADGKTVTFKGKVRFFKEQIPQVAKTKWSAGPPTWDEMWRAQQDSWLLRALLESIARVNKRKNANTIYDASIREIVMIMLRGGSKIDPAAGAAAGEGGTGAPGEEGMKMVGGVGGAGGGGASKVDMYDPFSKGGTGNQGGSPAMGRSMPPGGEGGEGMGGTGGAGGPISFDPKSIFGPLVPKEGAQTAEAGEGGTPTSAPGGAVMEMPGGGGGGAGGVEEDEKMSPYIDNDAEMPFKTRGFALQVLMKRKDVPLLIQELTDARKTGFPIEVLLVQQFDRNTDFTGSSVQSNYSSRTGTGTGGVPGAIPGGVPGGIPGGIPGGLPGGIGMPPGGEGTPGLRGGAPVIPGGIPGAKFPGGGGPMEGGAPGGGGMEGGNAPYLAALNDDGLGYVLIAGKMTIYQPPKKPEQVASSTDQKPQPQSGDPKTPTGPSATNGNTVPTGNKTTPTEPETTTPEKTAPESKTKKSSPAGTSGKQPAGVQPGLKSADPKQTSPPQNTQPKVKTPTG